MRERRTDQRDDSEVVMRRPCYLPDLQEKYRGDRCHQSADDGDVQAQCDLQFRLNGLPIGHRPILKVRFAAQFTVVTGCFTVKHLHRFGLVNLDT